VLPRQLPEAERLEPIGLDALDAAAALRRRFDTKYLLPRTALGELTRRLEPTHRVLEIEGLRDFEYRTTYFDTEHLGAFRDHVQGRRRRLKVRVRHYVETDACYFELKLRGPRGCTIKHRLPHEARLRRSLDADSRAALERWVRDEYDRAAPGPLAPVLDVVYRRTTLVAPDRGERLTVDLDLRMWALCGVGWCRLDSDLAVVESKSARGLGLAAHALQAVGARRMETMSKYCLGIVLAHRHARGNALLPVLRHCAGP
jgi:VTC domain